AMPPRKYTVNHRGGGGKHVSSADDVAARNRGEESRYDQARTARAEGRKPDDPEDSKPKKEDEGEESAEEEKPAPKKVAEKKPAEGGYPATANPNAGGVKHVDHVG
ncbi:unnamed protein product, partial [Polarella glacialis]